jgi:hypothetical protein
MSFTENHNNTWLNLGNENGFLMEVTPQVNSYGEGRKKSGKVRKDDLPSCSLWHEMAGISLVWAISHDGRGD